MPFIAQILSVLVAFGAIFYTYFKVKYQYWKKKNVPYIEPRVPFGSFESSSAKFKSFPDNIVDAYNVARKNNWSYIGVYTLYRPVLVVNDLDLIKNIMTKDFNHFVDRGFYTNEKDQPISAHLFAIGGVKWRNLRTKFTPTFTSGKMRMMFQTLADCGVLLEDYLNEISDKKDGVDIKNLLGFVETTIMSFIAEILSVLVAFGAIFYTYFKLKYQYWKKKNVPCIEPRIPLGSFDSTSARTKGFPGNIVEAYNVARKNNWNYIGAYALDRPMLIVADLDLIKNIMTKDFNHFVDRGVYVNEKHQPISAHLFAIGGVKWRNLRTKLTPTFTSGKMRLMFQTLADCGVLLEDYLNEISDKKDGVDIKNLVGCFSTDIIGSVAFGIECNTIKEPNSPFRVNSIKIFERNKISNLKNTIASSFPNVARALGVVPFSREAAKFFTEIVHQTVEYREKNNVERKDFLQLLIDINNKKEERGNAGDGTNLTMDEIVAQSFVFFIAGFETSATTMSFALYELAVHQDVQDKVREEIHRVLKKHNGQISYDSLKDMEFMQQAIDETLRMYPPIPILARESVDQYKVPGFDLIIDKGTRVLIPVKGIHYNENIYPEPNVFNPDRFAAEEKNSRHQYAHLPFGEGPRNCIGMRFGLMQTKVGLVSILKNHKVTLNEKTRVPLKFNPYSFLPQVEGGLWLNIEKV